MELFVYDEDLKPEHRGTNSSQTKFELFNAKTQKAIRAVGKAMYRGNQTHNAIYPTPVKSKS